MIPSNTARESSRGHVDTHTVSWQLTSLVVMVFFNMSKQIGHISSLWRLLGEMVISVSSVIASWGVLCSSYRLRSTKQLNQIKRKTAQYNVPNWKIDKIPDIDRIERIDEKKAKSIIYAPHDFGWATCWVDAWEAIFPSFQTEISIVFNIWCTEYKNQFFPK